MWAGMTGWQLDAEYTQSPPPAQLWLPQDAELDETVAAINIVLGCHDIFISIVLQYYRKYSVIPLIKDQFRKFSALIYLTKIISETLLHFAFSELLAATLVSELL